MPVKLFPHRGRQLSAAGPAGRRGLWVHAMETPNNRLYDLTPAEMLELKLATEADDGKLAQPLAKTRS